MDVVCPKCGSTKVMQIDYGGKLEMGVDISQNSAFKCKACKQKFGTVCGESEYSSIVKNFYLSINGVYANKDVIALKISAGDNAIKYKISSEKLGLDKKGTVSADYWKSFCFSLFNELYLTGWKSNFYNSELLDGTTWTLDVTLEKKHALSYRGCNGYPPYWNRLLSLLSPIFDETGINSTIFTV